MNPPTPVGSGDGGTSVNGQPGISNDDLSRNIHLTAGMSTTRGVIVAATATDDVETYSIGLAGAGSAAVAIAASVNVINTTTNASIGANAHVNDQSAFGLSPNSGQQVVVVASDDFRHTAAAAGLAISGGASVAPAVDVP